MKTSELKARIAEEKGNHKGSKIRYSISLIRAIVEACHESELNRADFFEAIGYERKGIFTKYVHFCKRAGIEPRKLRKPRSEKPLQDSNKYLNPQIKYHLDAAKALMEEEDYKMQVYNEMKGLINAEQTTNRDTESVK